MNTELTYSKYPLLDLQKKIVTQKLKAETKQLQTEKQIELEQKTLTQKINNANQVLDLYA